MEESTQKTQKLIVYENMNKFEEQIKIFEEEADEQYKERKVKYETVMRKMSAQTKKELSQWIMRAYFDKLKNKKDYWYNENLGITEENVLYMLGTFKISCFPHTLNAVYNQFMLNKEILLDFEKQIFIFDDDIVADKTEKKNIFGEHKLKTIGAELNSISNMMVTKLYDAAAGKVKKSLSILQSDLEEKYLEYLDEIIFELAKTFAIAFQTEKTLDDALSVLLHDKLFKAKDLGRCTSTDFKEMENVFNLSKTLSREEVEKIFVMDHFNVDLSKLVLFQTAVSRIVHPYNSLKKEEDSN